MLCCRHNTMIYSNQTWLMQEQTVYIKSTWSSRMDPCQKRNLMVRTHPKLVLKMLWASLVTANIVLFAFLPHLWLYQHTVLVLHQNCDVCIHSTPHWASYMGPAAGLFPKYLEMFHSGHNDLIYTLASGHSDWPPTGHSDLSLSKQPNP